VSLDQQKYRYPSQSLPGTLGLLDREGPLGVLADQPVALALLVQLALVQAALAPLALLAALGRPDQPGSTEP
jgi:hypothetical protein